MSTQNKIQILFEAKGDKKLQDAVLRLAQAQAILQGNTVKLQQSTKALTAAQNKHRHRVKRNTDEIRNQGKVMLQVQGFIARYRNVLLLAAFASGVLAKTVGRLTNLFSTQEEAEKKLNVAIGFTNQSLLDFASAQQKVTIFGDEATISAMAQAAAFTNNENAIKALAMVSQDFASARGVDLATSMDLIAKSVFSSTNALSRYGIEINSTLKGADRLNALVEELNRKFGGQARAVANTYAGSIQQLKNSLGDLGETLGKSLAEFLQPFVDSLKTLSSIAENIGIGGLINMVVSLGVGSMLTTKRLKSMGAALTSVGAATNLLTKSFALFAKASGVLLAIELFSRVSTFFMSTKEDGKDSIPVVTDLASGIGDLAGKLAAVTKITDAKDLLKFTQAQNPQAEIDAVTKSIEFLGDRLDKTAKSQKLLSEARNKYEVEAVVGGNEIIKVVNEEGVAREELLTTEKKADDLRKLDLSQGRTQILELEKKRADLIDRQTALKKDEVAIEKVIEQQRISNIKYQASIIPKFEKENMLLANKLTLTKDELMVQNVLGEAKLRDVEFTQTEIQLIEELAEKQQTLNDKLSFQNSIITGFTQILSSATKLSSLRMRDFADVVAASLQKIAAEAIATKIAMNSLERAFKALDMFKQFMANRPTGTSSEFGIKDILKIAVSAIPGVGPIAAMFMHNGGIVPSYHGGGQAQNVPAVLQEGEFVMKRSAVESIGIENLNRMNRTGQGGSVNINFTGNVLSDEFITETAIPQIKKAVRRGADLGV